MRCFLAKVYNSLIRKSGFYQIWPRFFAMTKIRAVLSHSTYFLVAANAYSEMTPWKTRNFLFLCAGARKLTLASLHRVAAIQSFGVVLLQSFFWRICNFEHFFTAKLEKTLIWKVQVVEYSSKHRKSAVTPRAICRDIYPGDKFIPGYPYL